MYIFMQFFCEDGIWKTYVYVVEWLELFQDLHNFVSDMNIRISKGLIRMDSDERLALRNI